MTKTKKAAPRILPREYGLVDIFCGLLGALVTTVLFILIFFMNLFRGEGKPRPWRGFP